LKRTLILIFALLIVLPAIASSQTRRRTSKPKPAPSTAPDPRAEGADRVAAEIKNLARVAYLIGGVGNRIELSEAAAQHGDASQAIVQKTATDKATLKSSLENIRIGMDKLENDFRNNPDLQRYYEVLLGVSASAANAEDQATAGKYDQAGRALLAVVNRLTDVLVAMRH
jgi:hypothetical protein